MNVPIPLAAILPFLFFFTGMVAENYKIINRPQYYINVCEDNNSDLAKQDRQVKCEQSYKLFKGE